MSDFTPKPKAQGMFNGTKVSFNKVWAGHTFTDNEVKNLLNGSTIAITGKGKKGTFHAKGKLAKQSYNGNEFYGFKPVAFFNPNKAYGTFKGQRVGFKKTWGGHTFTSDEIKSLLAGKTIQIKTAKGASIKGNLAKQSFKGHSYYGFKPDFDK